MSRIMPTPADGGGDVEITNLDTEHALAGSSASTHEQPVKIQVGDVEGTPSGGQPATAVEEEEYTGMHASVSVSSPVRLVD